MVQTQSHQEKTQRQSQAISARPPGNPRLPPRAIGWKFSCAGRKFLSQSAATPVSKCTQFLLARLFARLRKTLRHSSEEAPRRSFETHAGPAQKETWKHLPAASGQPPDLLQTSARTSSRPLPEDLWPLAALHPSQVQSGRFWPGSDANGVATLPLSSLSAG